MGKFNEISPTHTLRYKVFPSNHINFVLTIVLYYKTFNRSNHGKFGTWGTEYKFHLMKQINKQYDIDRERIKNKLVF